ncbi:MAG: J domain-containing protein [Deltaproteobacteria bacterium]|nr:J domain-containing protein [Deltaproteobacteria bacterium]
MKKYREITEARRLLQLPEYATMEEIKDQYRQLLNRWHPDKCTHDKDRCKEMTTKIIAAYEIITAYCSRYKYSFSREEVAKYLSGQDWWLERFGDDPLWGSGKKPE